MWVTRGLLVNDILSLATSCFLSTSWMLWGEQFWTATTSWLCAALFTTGSRQWSQLSRDWKLWSCEHEQISPPIKLFPWVFVIVTESLSICPWTYLMRGRCIKSYKELEGPMAPFPHHSGFMFLYLHLLSNRIFEPLSDVGFLSIHCKWHWLIKKNCLACAGQNIGRQGKLN